MGKSAGTIIPAVAGIAGAVLAPELLPAIAPALGVVEGTDAATALSIGLGAAGAAGGTALGDVATGQKVSPTGELLSAAGGGVSGYLSAPAAAATAAGTAPAAGVSGGAGAGVGAGGAGGASAAAAPPSVAPDVGAIGPSAVPTSGIDYSAGGYGGVGGGSAAAGGSTLTAGAVPGTGGSLASGAPSDAFSVGTAPGNFNAPSVTPGVGAVPSSTTATTAGGAAGGGGAGLISGHGGFLNALTSPGPVISLGALGVDALMQPKTPSISGTEGQLQSEASQLTTQGNRLQSYLSTGTLPPGVQGSLNQAAEAAKAAIRSQYAARGMSGSSAEAQDLANVDQTTATQGAQIATNLLSQGVSESNLGSELYQTILNTSLQQNQQLASAIGNFAASAAYGAPVRAATTPTA